MWEMFFTIGVMSIFALVIVLIIRNLYFGSPRIKKGVLVNKIHQEARKWIKDKAVTAGRYYLFFPFLYPDDVDWILVIKDEKGRVGKLFVDKETFESVKLGDVYTKKRGDRHIDWVITRGATKEEIETFPNIEPEE
jgi:hypothetical protein